MAFKFNALLDGYEYRGRRVGTGSNGKQWMSLILESPEDSSQIDVSVPVDLQDDVYSLNLQKGDFVTCNVLAVSSEKYSFVRVTSVPVVYDADGELV